MEAALQAKMAALSDLCYSKELKSIEEAKIASIVGYDSASGWSRYPEVLGYSFKHQVIDSQFVTKMEPVDVVILSYFAHNAFFSKPLDPLQYLTRLDGCAIDSLRNWDILIQKSNFIIILDTKVCKNEPFSLLTIRVFGGIPEIIHDDSGREVLVQHFFGTDMINGHKICYQLHLNNRDK